MHRLETAADIRIAMRESCVIHIDSGCASSIVDSDGHRLRGAGKVLVHEIVWQRQSESLSHRCTMKTGNGAGVVDAQKLREVISREVHLLNTVRNVGRDCRDRRAR